MSGLQNQFSLPRAGYKKQSRAAAVFLTRLLLGLLMLTPPAVVQAQFNYVTNNSTITITGYTGTGGAVAIPGTINGLPVTRIGDTAFYGTRLTSVMIPAGVTSLGNSAFHNCTNLTTVTIPNSVTSIGGFAFYNCTSLTSVTIPSNVTSIGDSAFSYCASLSTITVHSLNPVYSSVDGVVFDKSQTLLLLFPWGKPGSYAIPNTVTRIADYACFASSLLTSVTIPSTVTNIGLWAFNACTNLDTITVDALNSAYSSEDGVLLNKVQSVLLQCPGAKTGSYAIPTSVTAIRAGAFYYCTRLTNVTIPNNVRSIALFTFRSCSRLTSVTIPDSVTSIGSGAFDSCGDLTSVTIPNSVISIGNYAFGYCTGLINVTIPYSLTNIGDYAFASCSSLGAITVDALNPFYSIL